MPTTVDTCDVGAPYTVARIPEEDEELLRFLVNHEVIPGREIAVKDHARYRGVIVIVVSGKDVALGYDVASHIWVLARDGTNSRA